MEILLLLIICFLLILLIGYKIEHKKSIKVIETNNELNNYENLDELKDLIEKYKNIKNDDEWWKPCQDCQFFEGYDICTRKGNFGAVTDISKAKCEKYNLFQKK